MPELKLKPRKGSMRFTLLTSVWLWALALVISANVRLATAHDGTFDTPHEHIPNFTALPTVTSRQSGPWSAPSTWQQNRIPSNKDVVLIGVNHEVVYDTVSSASLAAVGIHGHLTFRTDVNTRLKVGTLLVTSTGKLTIGTATTPVAPHVTAEIVVTDRPLYTTSPDPDTGIIDPRQYGTGLLVLGEINIHGARKTPTWTRLAVEPRTGDTILQLQGPVVGWQPGDRIVLPDTRHLPVDHPKRADNFPPRTEVLTVSSVVGNELRLSSPLQFDHTGARNPDGTPTVVPNGTQLLPHVGNLTRNVVIRSENPAGTRGHTMFTFRAKVHVAYAGFYDLGRTTTAELDSTKFDASGLVTRIGTNQIGRYWVHLHRLWGPEPGTDGRPLMPSVLNAAGIRTWLETNGWQYQFIGNAIAASSNNTSLFKWGITIHDSHFGKVTDNVMYNIAGSGMQTEDGSESYNLFARNFAVRIPGEGHERLPKVEEDPDITGDLGKDGSGFWFRGPHNWVEHNAAADAVFSGLYYSGYYLKTFRLPLFPGANPTLSTQGITRTLVPFLSFADNEAYGPMQNGLWGAWPSGCCNAANWEDIKIDRFVAWHPYMDAITWYHSGKTTFTDTLLRGDPDITSKPAADGRAMTSTGMDFTFYENVELTVTNADIRGFVVGIDMPRKTRDADEDEPPGTVMHSVLQNYVNVRVPTAHSKPERDLLLNNVKFETFFASAIPNVSQPLHIYMEHRADDSDSNFSVGAMMEVRNYNQIPGDNFQVYYVERPAPCKHTRPAIKGYVCASSTTIDTTPPTPPVALRVMQ